MKEKEKEKSKEKSKEKNYGSSILVILLSCYLSTFAPSVATAVISYQTSNKYLYLVLVLQIFGLLHDLLIQVFTVSFLPCKGRNGQNL